MKFNLTTQTATQIKTDCLVLPILAKGNLNAAEKSIDIAENNLITRIKNNNDIGERVGQYILLPVTEGIAAKRLLLVNIGKNKKLSLAAYQQLIKAIFLAVRSSSSQDCTLL